MASLNKVQLIGNVGRDPEVRYLPNGTAVANFSIATTQRRKDKQTGETIEDTQWHRVTAYERLAEIVAEYIKKGSSVYVEGRLKYGKFTDDKGIERYTTDIVISELQMLGSRRDGGESGDARPSSAPTRRTAPAPAARPAAAAPAPAGGGSGFDDMDSDIPFRDPLSYRGAHLAL